MTERWRSFDPELVTWTRGLISAYRPHSVETSRTAAMLCRHAGDQLLWREIFAAATVARDRDVDLEALIVLSAEILEVARDAGVYREAAADVSEITWWDRNVKTIVTQWSWSYEGTSRTSN